MTDTTQTMWQEWCSMRSYSSVSPFSKMTDNEKAWEFVKFVQEETGNPVGIVKATELGAPPEIVDQLLKAPQ